MTLPKLQAHASKSFIAIRVWSCHLFNRLGQEQIYDYASKQYPIRTGWLLSSY